MLERHCACGAESRIGLQLDIAVQWSLLLTVALTLYFAKSMFMSDGAYVFAPYVFALYQTISSGVCFQICCQITQIFRHFYDAGKRDFLAQA